MWTPWLEKLPWRRKCQPTPGFLPGKSHGQRRLEGYSPWGHNESDMTERLNLLTYLILIPACASSSSSPVFLMMYSAYKLNKQGDNIQP